MDDDTSGQLQASPLKRCTNILDIICHEVFSCKLILLSIYTQARVQVLTKISDLIHRKSKNSVWIGRHVRPASWIYEVFAIKPLKILLSYLYAFEENWSNGIATGNATKSLVIHLVATGNMAAGKRESLMLMAD